MRLTRTILTAAAAALMAMTATAASAQAVVYDNGPPNGVDGNEMTNWIQAEDFSFGATTAFDGVRFWSAERGSFVPSTVDWWIFTDAAGQPGTILGSGNASLTRTASGGLCISGFSCYQNEFSVGGTSLGAGTYWLGLHAGPDYSARLEMYWADTDPNATNSGNESYTGTMNNWSANGQQHAFQLTAAQAVVTPEPASLALFATGLIGVAGVMRRRKHARSDR
jgi:hypothetical protein